MKKHVSIIICMLMAAACQDYRYDEMADDSFYFPASGLQQQTLFVMDDSDYTYPMWIHKSGYFQEKLSGCVELDYNYLVQYNNGNGTEYEMLSEDFFDFERNFTIPEGSGEVEVPLTLKTAGITNGPGYGKYYIPVTVKSLTPGIAGYEEKSHVLLEFDIRQATLTMDSEYKGKKRVSLYRDEISDKNIDITTVLSSEAVMDIEVEYAVIPDYKVTGSQKLLPENCYYFQPSAKIQKGERYAVNTLTLKVAEIPSGELFILPLKFGVAGNEKIAVDEKDYLYLSVYKYI